MTIPFDDPAKSPMTDKERRLLSQEGIRGLILKEGPWTERTCNYIMRSGRKEWKRAVYVNKDSSWLIDLDFENTRMSIEPLRWNLTDNTCTQIAPKVTYKELVLYKAELLMHHPSAEEVSLASLNHFRKLTCRKWDEQDQTAHQETD